MGEAAFWLERIRALKIPQAFRVLNVCGGHERTISMAGLRGVLPAEITLIPGPGCPVCVCPDADILTAIKLAAIPGHILVAFGDMLRVPANVAKHATRSLTQARERGADVRAVASPQEAILIASENPSKSVIFFAAGFETTSAPIAAMLAQQLPHNICLLLSLRRTWPAVAMLLDSGNAGFDALIAPGHVATVMGGAEWQFVVDRHHTPTAIAGFTAASILAALHAVLLQRLEGRPQLKNGYSQFVRPDGNQRARAFMAQAFDEFDAPWRGIGVIARSGFALQRHLAAHDARKMFPDAVAQATASVEKMPPGCDCAGVVMGRISPLDCRLYGKVCTPRTPVGPCMVSDEGACHIRWANGQRQDSANAA